MTTIKLKNLSLDAIQKSDFIINIENQTLINTVIVGLYETLDFLCENDGEKAKHFIKARYYNSYSIEKLGSKITFTNNNKTFQITF